jgi:hypothetical protein
VARPLPKELSTIDERNRDAVIEWLNDRDRFHTWFTSLITGSFVVLTVFGNKPGYEDAGQILLSVSLVLLILSVLCSLVCVWSIPSWKYRVRTRITADATRMRFELAVTAWIGVICFVSGLTLGFIGNMQ